MALAAWTGNRPGLCIFEETCGAALAMEHNGDVFACDHFVEPDYRLGNINFVPLKDMVGSQQQWEFGQAKKNTLPQYCLDCEVRFVCNGGCPKNRFIDTPDGEPGLNYLCAGYRAFFNHVNRPMQMMAAELQMGRPPANVMFQLAREKAGDGEGVRPGQTQRPVPVWQRPQVQEMSRAEVMCPSTVIMI